MKIAITKPNAGAGKWAWQGWENAFKALGHEIIDVTMDPRSMHRIKPDLFINSTSSPTDDYLLWRRNHPDAKVAMNVLAWTDEDIPGIKNPGVQATWNNIEYAGKMKADIVFAQYTKKWRQRLLGKWSDQGFKLGSMEMAADSTVYNLKQPDDVYGAMRPYDIVYAGGYWPYKAQNIDKYLLPVFRKHQDKRILLIGKGWPIKTEQIENEGTVGYFFKTAQVCPNVHEPHSTDGGFDVVERVFKTLYCGGLCVSDYVQEMEDGFGFSHGDHLIMMSDPETYQNIIDEILKHPEQYNHIRDKGQKFVTENHTYIHRATQLLKDLGL